jgi:hypothetical protein
MAESGFTNLKPISATSIVDDLIKMDDTGHQLEKLARQTEFSCYGFAGAAAMKETLHEPSSLSPPPLLCDEPKPPPAYPYRPGRRMNAGLDAPAQERIREYRIWSAYNVLCGCLLLGIGALIMSSETAEMKRKGDIDGARKASRITAIINFLATVIGICIIVWFVVRMTHS